MPRRAPPVSAILLKNVFYNWNISIIVYLLLFYYIFPSQFDRCNNCVDCWGSKFNSTIFWRKYQRFVFSEIPGGGAAVFSVRRLP